MSTSLHIASYSRPVRQLFASSSAELGVTRSRFAQAINIAMPGTILSLLSTELPRMPNCIHCSPSSIKFLRDNLHSTTVIYIGNYQLSIPSLQLTASLPSSGLWEPRPALSSYHWSRISVFYHKRLLASYLARHASPEGLAPLVGPLLLNRSTTDTPLHQMALPLLRLLLKSTIEQDIIGVVGAVTGLAGLGPGLTPSGDDVLGGFIAVMALLAEYLSDEAAFYQAIALCIPGLARSRTLSLSSVLLEHAAHGEVAEHLGNLLLSLALPVENSEVVQEAAARLLAYGATSGADTLLGVLLALCILEGA